MHDEAYFLLIYVEINRYDCFSCLLYFWNSSSSLFVFYYFNNVHTQKIKYDITISCTYLFRDLYMMILSCLWFAFQCPFVFNCIVPIDLIWNVTNCVNILQVTSFSWIMNISYNKNVRLIPTPVPLTRWQWIRIWWLIDNLSSETFLLIM